MLNKNEAPTIPASKAPFFHSDEGSRATPADLPDDSDEGLASDSDRLPEPEAAARSEAEAADSDLPEEAAASDDFDPEADEVAEADESEAPLSEASADDEALPEALSVAEALAESEPESPVDAVSVAALSEPLPAAPPNCDLTSEAPLVATDLASEANWTAPEVTWEAKLVPKLTAPRVTSW